MPKKEINMKAFERMVKWGAQPARLAQSFGISHTYARKLMRGLGVETAGVTLRKENDAKALEAKKLLEQGGIPVTEAARTLGVNVEVLRKRGVRSSVDRVDRNEVVGARNAMYAAKPTYANGKLRTVNI